MGDETRPTRRTVLKTTGGLAAAASAAGCSTDALGSGDQSDGEDSYTVAMEPVGETSFESVPERWLPYTGDYADMGVALGQTDGLLAVGIRDRFASYVYDELPGVDVRKDELTQLWQGGTDKELFYDLDADVHLVDPNFMINRIQWDRSDVEEIERRVAPFFGNSIFSGSYPWHDYEYYSLYEALEKVAAVFEERERYEALEEIHDGVLEDVQSRLPDERPNVAIVQPKSLPPEAFYPYVIDSGTQSKQWNDLEVGRALAESDVADFHESRGTVDYETLLEVDPDVIAVRQNGRVTAEEFESDVVSHMREHDVASDLTAVKEDRVIRGGTLYQGPIIHLFQLEQAARDLFPDVFGGEDLFDRQRVADVVTGDF
jgi:iron complex transport system substrate-binding protein